MERIDKGKTSLCYTKEEWEKLRNVDLQTVDRDNLVDIREVEIDENLSCEERMEQFIRQIKNPYCYRYGDVVVRVRFADTDVTLEDRIVQYLKNCMKSG